MTPPRRRPSRYWGRIGLGSPDVRRRAPGPIALPAGRPGRDPRGPRPARGPGDVFIQGRWAEAYPSTAARIVAAGHLVGSHSYYHARLPLFSDAGLAADISAAETAIRAATGVSSAPWFRCPFGAGHDDPRVLDALQAAGYRNVHWDVWAEDWDPDRSAAAIEVEVSAAALAIGDGAVVLLHTWPEPTLDALPGLIDRLRAGGADLVTIDALPTALPVLGRALPSSPARTVPLAARAT